MVKLTPFKKMSKRERRGINSQRRQGWGALNPATRTSKNLKIYDRARTRRWNDDEYSGAGFVV
jgi:hypothetical protein